MQCALPPLVNVEEVNKINHIPIVKSAVDLMNRKIPEPRWAIEEILPEGFAILGGAPKIGKSWFSLQMALAVIFGERIGEFPCVKGEVLLLALEDGDRRLQSRLRKLLHDGGMPHGLHYQTDWLEADKGGIDALDKWLAGHPAVKLVIIDTFVRFRKHRRAKDDIYEADYSNATPLKNIAERRHVCILAVHHKNKRDDAGDWLDCFSGSTGLTGSADSLLFLKRARGSAEGTLYVSGRDVNELERTAKWDNATCRWTLGGGANPAPISSQRREVLVVMQQAGRSMSPKELAERTGKNQSTVRGILSRMHEDGELYKDQKGLYGVKESTVLAVSTESTVKHSDDTVDVSSIPPSTPFSLGRTDGVDCVDTFNPEASTVTMREPGEDDEPPTQPPANWTGHDAYSEAS
jgi:hypothetical protein